MLTQILLYMIFLMMVSVILPSMLKIVISIVSVVEVTTRVDS